MGSPIPPKSKTNDLGIEIRQESRRPKITFDLEKIEQFKIARGADVFVEPGCRCVEDRCYQPGLDEELWLWREAVRANQ